jgi:hypothetical protein
MSLSFWEDQESQRENALFDYLESLADQGNGFTVARYGSGFIAFRNRKNALREDLGNFYVSWENTTFTSTSKYRLVGEVPVDGGVAYIYNSPQ